MQNMTEISRQMYADATSPISVADAAALLHKYGQFRTLGDILRAFSGCDSPKEMLVDGLMSNTPSANRDSLDKKVRNWLNGRTYSISKQDAFEVSRIFRLDLDQTDAFLKQVTGEGIHWRDPEEIVWGYSIVNELSYAQTQALLDRVAALQKRTKKAPQPTPDGFTAEVKEKILPLIYRPEEELLAYLTQARNTLGAFHNTAHQLFMQYLRLLESGGAGDEGKMSAQEILESYLYRQLVPVAKRKEAKEKNAFSGVQRSIRMSWPDEATLSKMKSRELDVSRKVLILLFLATDGSESEFEELDEDEDILTRDEIFLNIYTRINRMLQACGFQLLDPRSPFDWLVLYCICVDDLWDVDRRLRDMLLAIFPDGNENQ